MTCPKCRGLMIPERDHHGEYSGCLACGYVSYPEPVDYTPATKQGRKEERLIGRSKREPHRKQRNSTRNMLGSKA